MSALSHSKQWLPCVARNTVSALVVSVGVFGATSSGVRAQSGSPSNPQDGELQNPLSTNSITEFVAQVLDVVAMIAFPFVVLAIIYTGFLFVKAQGNDDKLKEAKQALFYTLIGALIVLGATTLADAIQGTIDQLRG